MRCRTLILILGALAGSTQVFQEPVMMADATGSVTRSVYDPVGDPANGTGL